MTTEFEESRLLGSAEDWELGLQIVARLNPDADVFAGFTLRQLLLNALDEELTSIDFPTMLRLIVAEFTDAFDDMMFADHSGGIVKSERAEAFYMDADACANIDETRGAGWYSQSLAMPTGYAMAGPFESSEEALKPWQDARLAPLFDLLEQ